MMAPMNVTDGQCSIIYDYGKSIPAGTEVTVVEGENKLLSWETLNDFTTVNLTCPEMVMGKKYVVAVGDERDEVIIESEIQYAGITWE